MHEKFSIQCGGFIREMGGGGGGRGRGRHRAQGGKGERGREDSREGVIDGLQTGLAVL